MRATGTGAVTMAHRILNLVKLTRLAYGVLALSYGGLAGAQTPVAEIRPPTALQVALLGEKSSTHWPAVDVRLVQSIRSISVVEHADLTDRRVPELLLIPPTIRGNRTTHVLIGIGIGALAGFTYVLTTNGGCHAQPSSNGPPCGFDFVPALVVFGAGGGAVGGLIGAVLPSSQ